jgi:hypothetical protein
VIGTIFILMPKAVIGAALVFTASFMISGGIQIMVSRNIDTRMTYVIGIALLRGLAREVYTDFFRSLPTYLQPLSSTAQVIEHLHETKLVRSGLTATLSYDEIDLVVTIEYRGILLSLPYVGIRHHVLVEEEAFSYGLADFLTGVYPDRMESRARGDSVSIRLVFSVGGRIRNDAPHHWQVAPAVPT